MKYFKKYFADVDFEDAEEVKVLCPFHDDTRPSASVNTEKSVFHCLVCNTGLNEHQFIAEVNGISKLEASKVLQKLSEEDSDWLISEKAYLLSNEKVVDALAKALHISKKTIDRLDLGLIQDNKLRDFIGIPVFYNRVIMDVRRYNFLNHNGFPKIKSNKGAENGWVIPFDQWQKDKPTYIFEGEKDTILAQDRGLNAITLTGGANALPNEFMMDAFKDQELIICYDNDEAGRSGSRQLYKHLHSIAKSIRYINIGEVVKEDKEDFFDMIIKYEKTVEDFLTLPLHEFEMEQEIENQYETLKEVLSQNKIKRRIKSKVVVSGEFGDIYAVPELVTFTKLAETNARNETMVAGEQRTWILDKTNFSDALELIEVSAKKEENLARLRKFVGIPPKEGNVDVSTLNYRSIFKSRVSDQLMDTASATLDIYTFEPMTVGKQYEIEYKIYPHPTKNQKLVAVGERVISLDDFDNYKPNKELLSQFQSEGSINDQVQRLYESAKHHIAKHLNFNIWLMDDLTFNSILEFEYGEKIRGSLDVFILGDTQVGKSETAQKLVDLYNFGHFISLKTSTIGGLIGGSNKIDGSYLNTIGSIPRQHKGLAVLEEFSGAQQAFIKTMTDIRSSGKLRLSRVSGEMEVDVRLRMITISNPINDENGNPRHLSTFPNGVLPIMELVKSAEDVARYDAFLLVPKPKDRFNPFSHKLNGEPIPKEAYHNKVLWVATRNPEDVIFADDSDSYIWEKAEDLNDLFESNFPLFTTTTSQKLARFSVALASLLMHTDKNFEKVIVTKEIVDYIVGWLVSIYDNPVFKLKDHKKEYESYAVLSEEEIKELEKLYVKNATLLDFLSHQSVSSQPNLKAVSGLDSDDFGIVFNKLVRHRMVRLSKGNIYPTPKFITGMNRITKEFTVNTGEMINNADDDEIF